MAAATVSAAITLTYAAGTRVKAIMAQRTNPAVGLRLGMARPADTQFSDMMRAPGRTAIRA